MVIAGGGRVGMQIATTLQRQNIPFVVVELDQRRVEQAKTAGFAILYGDASHEIVLKAASMASASLLVITIPGIVESRAIVAHAQRINSTIEIVARLSDPQFFYVFSELQVTDLVYPELEAGLEMTRQILLSLHIPVTEIQRHTESLRQEFFTRKMSRGKPYQTLAQFRSAEQQFDLQWVTLTNCCRLDDRCIGEAEIRKKTGDSVMGILRGETLEPNPGPEFRFQENDPVAIIGSAEARASFQSRFFPADEPQQETIAEIRPAPTHG